MKHEISRVRHELKRRSLTVRRTEFLTPHMLRLTLGGEDLDGFVSLGPDDHVKLLVPGDGDELEKRDYTPRRFDAQARELTIDFALHDAGPATNWARNAQPGDPADIGGPRGSMVVPHDFDWWLLIGDETALPAIGRRIEELPAGTRVTSIVSVTGNADEQVFETGADHHAIWVHRPLSQDDDPAPLLNALKKITLPDGDGFVWIAAEAGVMRSLKEHVIEVLGHSPEWMKASGYWVKGQADA